MFSTCKNCDVLKELYGKVPDPEFIYVQKDYSKETKYRFHFCPMVVSEEFDITDLKNILLKEDYQRLGGYKTVSFERIKILKKNLLKDINEIKFFLQRGCPFFIENIIRENIKENEE